MARDFDRVTVIAYGAIGDFVMTLLLLERLHASLPGAPITVAATRNAPLLREMAAGYPFIEVASLDRRTALPLLLRSWAHRPLVIVPPTFTVTPRFIAWWARLASVRGKTAGLVGPQDSVALGTAVPFDPSKLFHENLSALLKAIDCLPIVDTRAQFAMDASAVPSEPYIAVAPFASNPGKTLPLGRWADLLRFVSASYPALRVVLLGGPQDAAYAARLAGASGAGRVEVRCGAPFAQAAACIARSRCFIGPDSGLMHVAGALRVPSVAIENLRAVTWLPSYNPRAIILTAPEECLCGGDKTGNCYREIGGIRYLRCMIDVPQEEIYGAITGVLE
jgi:ADP-heptose:LPS heptosyltransferase